MMSDEPTNRLMEAVVELQRLVEAQAEDQGLWFIARTAPEAYLQQELRRLHRAVEQANEHVSKTPREQAGG